MNPFNLCYHCEQVYEIITRVNDSPDRFQQQANKKSSGKTLAEEPSRSSGKKHLPLVAIAEIQEVLRKNEYKLPLEEGRMPGQHHGVL
ncbi:MAG: hypothetical protein U7123_26070 [Potamolinea sp.]